ncbi:4Fe-4S binding protein [Stetteria hydrogenophila]
MGQRSLPVNVEEPKTFFYAPLSRPAPGSSGKTGTWRDYRPVVDESKCTRCLLCWLYCPEDTILRREDDMVYVDYEYCKGCGICANVCPVDAIKMVPEER